MPNTIRAGRICGDPTAGLCERICIEVNRVYDGCRESFESSEFTLSVTNISPQATPPFTFVSAQSSGNAVFRIVSVTTPDTGKSTVAGEITIPVTVTLLDTYGNSYAGTSEIRLYREFLLNLPPESLAEYRVEVMAFFGSQIGTFTSSTTVAVTGCLAYVVKVIVPTDIVIPTYGLCVYPCCNSVDTRCNFISGIPLFPELI